MNTRLKFYNASDRSPSDCGAPLVIEKSSRDLGWDGVLLEKGWSPHFHPENIVTPYFYFALELNMSKFHFLREFKKAVGKTPHQYLVEIKMREARKLMGRGELNLADIALRLGYSDQSHFSRVFKQTFGDTPGKFRKKLPASP